MRGDTQADRAEILVAGGGPAGCAAALGLARVGFEVVLVTAPRRPAVVEGLSARVVRFLEQAGNERALATLGPSVRRQASWNGTTTSANLEWVVERAAFDRALLEEVSAAGVRTVDAPLRRLRFADDGWHAEAGGHAVGAPFLVEARGRRAPGRRRHGPGAIALARTWTGLRPRPCTALAPFSSGFAWFATTGNGRGSLQLVVEPGSPAEREALLADPLGSVPPAREWLEGGRPCAPVTVRHAGTSRAEEPLEPARIRIGDAALALDPLSGHGVFEAFASATAAVPVTTTLLRRPDDAALARAFYEERVEQAFLRFARVARDFYRLEERWREAPFWRARRSWPDDLPAHASALGAPQIRTKPVIEDGFVVAREVVVTADHPRGVFQVDGVPLVPLLRAVEAGSIEETSRRFERAPAQVETALAWLRYRGLLRS